MAVKIAITGDYCPIGRNKDRIEKGDFTSFFGDFVTTLKDVDYAVTNLECPITNHNNTILKSGPSIKGPLDGIKPLKEAGFDLVTLANNHILDYDEQGVRDTMIACTKEKMATVGAGNSLQEARKIFFTTIKGKKFGFINIAENEFCAATQETAGANPLDLINNHKDIRKAREEADYVIVIAHGGREHYQLPTPKVRERYRFYIDSGADVVVAHHPHCYSGYERYNDKAIFYSLGNFIFDYKPKYQKGLWTEGMAVILSFSDSKIDFEIIPFFQGRTDEVALKLMEGNAKEEFDTRIKELNTIIKEDTLFYNSWDAYIKTQAKSYKGLLFLDNMYLRALVQKGMLPLPILKSKNRKALLLNLYRCETHREIMMEVLKKEISE